MNSKTALFEEMNSHIRKILPLAHPCAPHAFFWPIVWLAALAFVAQPVRAAVTEAWVQRYSNVASNSADQAFKVVRDAAGDIIVAGYTDDSITGRDTLTIKYSGRDGSVLWQKRYNGPANGDDSAQVVAVDGGGNVVVTGYSNNGTNNDYYTAKYAVTDGALLWEHRYNGPANGNDSAQVVAVDGNGNVVVTGYSNNGTNNDYYTAKYAAADGALLWEHRYNGPANGDDNAQAVAVDGSGNVVVTGVSGAAIDDAGRSVSDYYTAKYAATDGALLWEKRYDGPANSFDGAHAVAVDGSGNVVVTGFSENGTNLPQRSNDDYYTAKYAAANGALLWEKRYNGPGNNDDGARAVAVDGSGNVVVTGDSWNGTNSDYYTAKYAAADGALLWEKRYNGPANKYDFANTVAVDSSGNVVVTGHSNNGTNNDYYTTKYAAADGALLWEKRYNGPANSDDEAVAVAVDGSGNVVVTGSSYNGSSYDYYTAKYAATDGALLWDKRYNGLANSHGSSSAVAVDGSGNVMVTGRSWNGTNSDYYTAKYAVGNGALLWEQRYNGPANKYDFANTVAVDSSGNVVVTGYSNNGTNNDYYTAKYAVGNGALLWEQRYNGPANSDDEAMAVAVDGSGNVVVTGGSSNTTNRDCYTAKYAAADGALLWEKRYNGPANHDDIATAVALDANGNVVVTGYSRNGLPGVGNSDYYTAKYAATDGALLWEKRYNGPANGDDNAHAVAVDNSGNVVVTGRSVNGSDDDYYTAKYAASNGALLWEKRYNGPAHSQDSANAVAVDASGNVIVTGYSDNATNGDYYTAKYAAVDGTLLWEKRYNGPANSYDVAQAVAVDASGNVVVTGSSANVRNGPGDYGGAGDYYTAKYAAADGALLWEKRYNGPANGDDFVGTSRSLAVGPNGMVAVTGSSDGNFGSGGTYNYATVVYRENLPPVSIALVPTGIRLRFTGVPGRSYTIERAITVPGLWSTIATPTAPLNGVIEYIDANPSAVSAFYRASAP